MSYRVLARTYRSNTFDEVVGQESVATTLKNAVASGRVHHGYLFTGTRGVGKTSMARILAKALNCLACDAPTTTPCCGCDSCRAIAIGEDVDVVEIDAASNTGVDNIRDLRSNATFRPARSRFKVYIIDEVHMLSTGAFNALLKTLEEPPSHVKFILATTESQKVPATIKSRCQRFDFHAIDAAAIAQHLRRIVEAEGVQADDEVLRRIARLGNGSMRDALSLLDKVLSYEPKHLTAAVVEELIPPPHDELSYEVVQCLAQSDAAGALGAMDRALQSGRTVERFCNHLIEHVRTLMFISVCGTDTELVDVAGPLRPKLAEQAAQFDAATYVYIITLLEELRRNVKFSGAARALADAAVVRLAMCQQFTDIKDLLARLDGAEDGAAAPLTPSAGAKKKAAPDTAVVDQAGQPPAQGSADSSPGANDRNGSPLFGKQGPESGEKAIRSGLQAQPSEDQALRPEDQSQSSGRPVAPSTDPLSSSPDPRPSSGMGAVESADQGPAPRSAPVNARYWQRVSRDPFVQRVKEAVDGTLTDVRAAQPPRPDGEPVDVPMKDMTATEP